MAMEVIRPGFDGQISYVNFQVEALVWLAKRGSVTLDNPDGWVVAVHGAIPSLSIGETLVQAICGAVFAHDPARN